MASIPATVQAPEWYADVPRDVRRPAILGLVLMVVCFGGFGIWGAAAPLASAVIASGSFVATGSNKIVQHLEGGIIETILVAEGDHVVEGQNLIKLNETAALARARRLQVRMLRLEAVVARLQATARGASEYVTPDSIAAQISDEEVEAIDASQREHFMSSMQSLQNRIRVVAENIVALEFQHQGLLAQQASLERQRDLISADLAAESTLLERGVATRSSVNSVERNLAEVEGDISRISSDVQITLAQIERYQREVIQLRDAHQQAALDELQGVDAEMETLREELRDAENILERTAIQAPVSGIVVRLHYHTAGGVIASGLPIVEILPSDVPLIIEAAIPRMQIDEIKLGQDAIVRLPALNQRTTPMLEGEVIYVSADAIVTPGGGASKEVYLTRIDLPPAEIARVANFQPTPGMPAEILIKTEERTFFEYLVKPITDSMARAFRER
jgi:HlyD family secretion protein